jgi:hypothetical protein
MRRDMELPIRPAMAALSTRTTPADLAARIDDIESQSDRGPQGDHYQRPMTIGLTMGSC